jgi:hypothetical protein
LLLESLEQNGPSDDEIRATLKCRLDDLRSGKDRGQSFEEASASRREGRRPGGAVVIGALFRRCSRGGDGV